MTSSDTEHALVTSYWCKNCGAEKTESVYEDHTWTESWDYGPEPYSDTQHSRVKDYTCEVCDAEKTETVYENHTWKSRSTKTEPYNSTQHEIVKYYYCNDCGEEKEETTKENHVWKTSFKYDYVKKNGTYHTFKKDQHCMACDESRTVSPEEKHHFDKYNNCKECGVIKGKNVTLTAGTACYTNAKSWLKLQITTNGYITVTVKTPSGYDAGYTVYDANKAAYIDCKSLWGKSVIATKKGTYYIKVKENAKVTYTFKKDPAKKNYTRSAAITLKAGDTATSVLYPTAAQKTWMRVYKITLTQSQYLHIKTKRNGYVSQSGWVYDSKGNYIQTDLEYNKEGNWIGKKSAKKLPKGTYYIEFNEYWPDANKKRNTGSVYTLSWK